MDRVIFKIGTKKSSYLVENTYITKCKNQGKVYSSRNKLDQYLKKCFYLKVLLTETKCIFTRKYIGHYHSWRTDGAWVWSSDLEHYSKDHSFQWPKEFLDHIIRKNYVLDFEREGLFEISRETKQNFDLRDCEKLI